MLENVKVELLDCDWDVYLVDELGKTKVAGKVDCSE